MSSAALKSQIAGLQRKLAKVEVSNGSSGSNPASTKSKSKARRRRRNRNSGANNGATGAAYVAPRVQQTNPRRQTEGGTLSADGSIRVRRTEYVKALKLSDKGTFTLLAASFPWLKGLSDSFDRIRWHACSFKYRPSVGTNVGGQLLMGMDWDSNVVSTVTMEAVASSTPVFEAPVWQAGTMQLPGSRLMSRKEYVIRPAAGQDTFDGQPGSLMYFVSGSGDSEAGHLWVTYDVSMFGTVQAK